ncbi:hypothetical protein [Photobacterium leiognathi]|uniref:hypothetical protein n=1 Tax=Photobacterium leiognathi TaxID=553611 RepID=UPI002982982A|nr:hypothetical protein [Photobacterium leiognathi]
MKLAIFISGPVRYLEHVISQIESQAICIDYDFFIHVWQSDNSNKIRNNESDIKKILYNNKIKSFIIERPASNELFIEKYGDWTNTHSTVGAMFGMFNAINKLINCLKCDPEYDNYSHIFRIRTDIAFFNKRFFEKIDFNSNDVYLAKNYILKPNWVSDHLMLCKKKQFESIWQVKNFDDFNKSFSFYARNPEYYLKYKVPYHSRCEIWDRYVDYHVVYNPININDPKVLNDIIIRGKVDDIFYFTHDDSTLNDILIFNQELSKRHVNYHSLVNRIKRIVKRFINKKVAV